MNVEDIAILCSALLIKEKETLRPWTFDRATIIFEEPQGSGDILNMVFNKVDFWIKIHQIPLLCMTKEIRVFFRDINLSTSKDGIGYFLRVRVTIAVYEPLKRNLRVDLLGTEEVTTFLLRYERLAD
ncbi:hypothetical protein Dsin_003707 [Dipteronia sinensis]|uniref:DUF4283 domain-containing protein n=1 Tax=Dipteronia sinensis TaxID=43782 RepID=A0AAE0B8L3_9ROSI|nr:hypothetical protein Dsin_003707 [Dipteronia sinensis]